MVEDLTGKHFGRLEVIKYIGLNKENRSLWLCQCECGNQTIVTGTRLRLGITKSCGCYKVDLAIRHCKDMAINKQSGYKRRKFADMPYDKHQKRLQNIYAGIIKRCLNVQDKKYGGRGITVCKEWQNFINFYNWAISNGYKDNLTIDRIDVNGNYEPSNCRWATQKQQQNNRRNNHYITFRGETHTLAEWAEICGINQYTLSTRLQRKWSIERALTQKVA